MSDDDDIYDDIYYNNNYNFGRGDNDMEYLYQNKDEEEYMRDDELGVGEKNKEPQDPVQKFTSFVKSVAKRMSSEGYINLTTQDIQFILNNIDKIPSPVYKNATGLVIGYWLVSSKSSYNAINRKRYNTIKQNLKNIEYPLEEKDVIRYARFWILHNLLPEFVD
jgi:hypothetical protein